MGPYGPQPGPGPNPDWAPTRSEHIAKGYLQGWMKLALKSIAKLGFGSIRTKEHTISKDPNTERSGRTFKMSFFFAKGTNLFKKKSWNSKIT